MTPIRTAAYIAHEELASFHKDTKDPMKPIYLDIRGMMDLRALIDGASIGYDPERKICNEVSLPVWDSPVRMLRVVNDAIHEQMEKEQ